MKLLYVLMLFLAISLYSYTSRSESNDDKCMVYAYIDDSGLIVKTTDKRSIPERFLTSLISTRDCKEARAIQKSGGEISKVAPAVGQEKKIEAEKVPTTAGQASFSEDSPTKRLYAWFAFTKRWKVILLLFFASALLAGTIGVVVTAFHHSTLWGLLCLLPPLAIVYLVFYWSEVWPSALVWITGLVGGSIMVFFVLSLV